MIHNQDTMTKEEERIRKKRHGCLEPCLRRKLIIKDKRSDSQVFNMPRANCRKNLCDSFPDIVSDREMMYCIFNIKKK